MIFLHYIYSMKKEIKILPIFNPEKCDFWANFQLLYKITAEYDYDMTITPANLQTLMQNVRDSGANILFGAYDGNKMVGCMVASASRSSVKIQYLHVLPEYQKHRIGTQLLSTTECAASLVAKKAELISWGKAENFYKRHKYTSPTHDNKYEKDIRNAGNYTVQPVFSRTKKILNTFAEISSVSYDTIKQEIKPRTPVFVYRSPDIFISGYGYINDKNESVIYTHAGNKFVREQIAKRIAMHQQRMSEIR